MSMAKQEPTPEDRDAVAKAVYDHVRRTFEDEGHFYEVYLGKVHKAVTVQVTLFAGMAYAVGELDWIHEASIITIWVVGALASLGALSLIAGFICGLQCLGICETSVVGIKLLNDLVKDGKIAELRPDQLYGDLSQNLANAVIDERDRKQNHKLWNKGLNRCTLAGFLFVAAFVGSVTIGKLVNPVNHEQQSGGTIMNDIGDPSNSPQPEASGSTQSTASDGGSTPDRVSVVEQGETSQRDVGSTRPSVVEKSPTIPMSIKKG